MGIFIHSYTYTNSSSTSHFYNCACGLSGNENHSLDSNGQCLYCDYEQHVHSYSYSYYDSTYHKKTCSCGVNELEAHLWMITTISASDLEANAVIGPRTCSKCGAT